MRTAPLLSVPRVRTAGFTLVELMMVLAVAAVLAAVSLPNLRGNGLRMGRLDAAQALTRLQGAQEAYRAQHGQYTTNLAALRGMSTLSTQGRYELAVQITGPESYQAVASARGEQVGDHECAAITLNVSQGFATQGPKSACWGR